MDASIEEKIAEIERQMSVDKRQVQRLSYKLLKEHLGADCYIAKSLLLLSNAISDGNIKLLKQLLSFKNSDGPLADFADIFLKCILYVPSKKQQDFINQLIALKQSTSLFEEPELFIKYFSKPLIWLEEKKGPWYEPYPDESVKPVFYECEEGIEFLLKFINAAGHSKFRNEPRILEFASQTMAPKKNWNIISVLEHAKLEQDEHKHHKCAETVDEVIEVSSLDLPDWLQPLHRIGKGNVGKVYRARNTFLNTELAVKVAGDTSEKTKQASVSSIPRLWNVSSPYILKHHIGFPYNGKIIVIMDLFEQTLEERLVEAGGKLPFLEAMKYFEQIARGLSMCHLQDIVHPDLAPYNIGIDAKGDIKIADFNEGMYPDTGELKHGGIRYSAPERFKNEQLTKKSNLWSLGVILYEMLTGELLFSPPKGIIDKDNQRTRYKAHIILKQREVNKQVLATRIESINISDKEVAAFVVPEWCESKTLSLASAKEYEKRIKSLLLNMFEFCFGVGYTWMNDIYKDAGDLLREYQRLKPDDY